MDTILAKQNDERVVREYQCTRWAQPKLTGNLIVTTERVIFEGAAEKKITDFNTNAVTIQTTDRIVEEAELKSVSGLSSFYGRKVNWLWLLLGIGGIVGGLCGFIASIEVMTSRWVPPELIVAGVVGLIFSVGFIALGIVILIKLAFGKAFFLNVYSSQSAGTPISIGNADRANHVLLSLAGLPTDQTDQMMKELGALIADLKTDKEQAYETWREATNG